MTTLVGWLGILIVSAIVALVLVLRPNVHAGEGSGSYAVLIVLAVVGAVGFLAIVGELFIRWTTSSALS